MVEFYDYAGALLRARRQTPGDDLISTLSPPSRRATGCRTSSALNLVLNVLVGGVDTTQSQLAHGIRLFAEHPDQWELLARSPELVAGRRSTRSSASSRSRRSPRGSCTRRSSSAT